MSISIFTNWAVGVINGYKYKENGLPSSIKYGTIGSTTFMAMIKVLGQNPINSVTPGQKLAGLFIGVPIVMGTNFCIGHHMGKSIRYLDDSPKSNKKIIKL